MDKSIQFSNREALRVWFKENHDRINGIWIIFSKIKDDGNMLKPMEALEESLCFGWVDSKIKRIDDTKYMKYFSKRSEKSTWSALNKRLVGKLIKEQRMEKPGLATIQNSQEHGYWAKENNKSPNKGTADFAEVIQDNADFLSAYTELPPSHQKKYAAFYFDAKKETTKKSRLEKIEKAIREKSKRILY